MNIGNKKIIYRKTVDGLFLYLLGKEEIFIAGKEFKGNTERGLALEVLEQEKSDSENEEMIEIINSTVGKLQQIEDKYYYSLDLNYYLNNLEDDAYEA